ncbi:signal recognition particle-docking protein FtsY [bacterium]|nr:signal recognition particle-docking protein FtsY [bacterium]
MFWFFRRKKSKEDKKRRKHRKNLKNKLTKTRSGLILALEKVIRGAKKIDKKLFEELEELLISADVGVKTTERIMSRIQEGVDKEVLKDPEQLKSAIKEEIFETLTVNERLTPSTNSTKPHIVLIVGVNGTGKTTSIAKLAYQEKAKGKVLVAAADTFRAAAIEQLGEWCKRAGVDLIKHQAGADPSAVVFDAMASAKAKNIDYLIVDTAGRLHTKVNLMEELKKIQRVIKREVENAPHEILLVLDATTGQNAIQQAIKFRETVDISGIILTKLDGTAKGGVIVGIADELKIPIKYIGIGEKMEDLAPFSPKDFVETLFES